MAIAAPTGHTSTPVEIPQPVTNRPGLRLAWVDNSNNETGFDLRLKSQFVPTAFQNTPGLGLFNSTAAQNATQFDFSSSPGETYVSDVRAFNASKQSTWSNTATGSISMVGVRPAAATNLRTTSVTGTSVALAWNDNANNELSYSVWDLSSSRASGQANTTSASISGLTPGTTYTFVVVAVGGGSYFQGMPRSFSNVLTVTTPEQSAFGGVPPVLGSNAVYLEAENFDDGGEGYSYHDTTTGNAGNVYRTTDVDLTTSDGSYVVQNIVAGEWLEYTVNVQTAGDFWIEARGACALSGSTFHLDFDGTNATGAVAVPNTGSWNAYTTYGVGKVYLEPGLHVVRAAFDANIGNLNWLKFSRLLSRPADLIATPYSDTAIDLSWTDMSGSENGFVIEASFDGTDFEEVGRVGANVTTFRFGEAMPNTSYHFRVSAYTSVQTSFPSNVAAALTFPRAPQGLSVTEQSTSEAVVEWDGDDGLTSYRLQRRINGGSWVDLPSLGGSAFEFADTGLQEGTRCEYRLRSANATGVSALTEVVETYTMLRVPTSLEARAFTGVEAGLASYVRLTWSDNSAEEAAYVIEQSSGSTGWVKVAETAPSATRHNVEHVAEGASYAFRIRAKAASTESVAVTTAPVTVPRTTSAADYAVLERLEVPVDGTSVWSNTVLANDVTYKIRASGSAYIGAAPDGQGDAEYGGVFTQSQGFPAVDYGIGINDRVNDETKSPYWGEFSSDRVYTADFAGQGAQVEFTYHDEFFGDNVGSLTVEILLPKVSMRVTKSQAAEGGSEPGEFVISRTGDVTAPLTVRYGVTAGAGHATNGVDYEALTGTVTIPAGSDVATIAVRPVSDGSNNEPNENVNLYLEPHPSYAIVNEAETTSLRILDRQKILLSTYGLGPIGPATANSVLRALSLEISARRGFANLLYTENRYNEQLSAFLARLNDDYGSKSISKAEAESAEVSLIGYSLGAVNVHNFTLDFVRVGKRPAGLKLEHQIMVQELTMIDPVPAGLRWRGGALESNVQSAHNYYQANGRKSVVDVGTYQAGVFTKLGEGIWGGPQRALWGHAATGASNVRVDKQMAATTHIRRYYSGQYSFTTPANIHLTSTMAHAAA